MTEPHTRRLFSADSHYVITTDQVKKNLTSQYHQAWDDGMDKFDTKHDTLQTGKQLALWRMVPICAGPDIREVGSLPWMPGP